MSADGYEPFRIADINGAVSGGKHPLAVEPEHWTYALGPLSGVTVDARTADQRVHLGAQRALAIDL